MTRHMLIAASVALALSVSACGRDENRADANRTAPGANTAVSPPPALPQDNPSARGGTSGMGASGSVSGPADGAATGADATSGMGTGAASAPPPSQPYGSQSDNPPNPGSGSMSR